MNKYGTIGDSDNSDHYHLHFISNDFYNQRTVNLGPARSKKLYAISKASLQEMNVYKKKYVSHFTPTSFTLC